MKRFGHLLVFPSSNYGVPPRDPQREPELIVCATCGEDVYEGELCLECANGERPEAA